MNKQERFIKQLFYLNCKEDIMSKLPTLQEIRELSSPKMSEEEINRWKDLVKIKIKKYGKI